MISSSPSLPLVTSTFFWFPDALRFSLASLATAIRLILLFRLGVLHGVLTSPLGSCLIEGRSITLVLARDIWHQRIVGVGVCQ